LKNIDKRREGTVLVKHLRDISIDGCNAVKINIGEDKGVLTILEGTSDLPSTNPERFDPENPTGHYILKLEDHYQRTVATRLLELARENPGENIKNVKMAKDVIIPPWHQQIAGVPVKLIGAVRYDNFDEDDPDYKIPDIGVIQFDFYEVKRLPSEEQIVTNDTIPHLAKALLGQPEGMQRMNVLTLIAAEKLFCTEHVDEILDCFTEMKSKTRAMAQLWGCVWDQQNMLSFVRDYFKPAGVKLLREELGALYSYNRNNCTGHYKLDTNHEHDIILFRRLQEVSSEEQKQRHVRKLMDLSQDGTNEGWRNAKINGEACTALNRLSNTMKIPENSVLEFDFISYTRPGADRKACSQKSFDEYYLMLQKAKEEGKLEFPRTDGEEDLMIVLRWTCDQLYFRASDVAKIMCLMPVGHKVRLDIMVCLWSRLLDEENLKFIFDCIGFADRQELYRRIGYLNLFNPIRPDGYYKLDLKTREEYIVATILIQLAKKEPGDNCVNERYDGEIFEAPQAWLTELPTDGLWELEYVTPSLEGAAAEKAGRNDCAKPALRKQIAEKALGWEFHPDWDYDEAL